MIKLLFVFFALVLRWVIFQWTHCTLFYSTCQLQTANIINSHIMLVNDNEVWEEWILNFAQTHKSKLMQMFLYLNWMYKWLINNNAFHIHFRQCRYVNNVCLYCIVRRCMVVKEACWIKTEWLLEQSFSFNSTCWWHLLDRILESTV